MVIQEDEIALENGSMPIYLIKDSKKNFIVSIGSNKWLKTENEIQAIVLFNMMKDNITNYLHY